MAPLVVASPSFLSLTWFPERERNTATAIANVASALGRAIGFFLGPGEGLHCIPEIVPGSTITPPLTHLPQGLVPHDDPAHIPSLLYVETGLSILPLIGVLVYYPDHPAAPPSKAAAAARTALLESQKQSQSLCASIGSSVRDVVRASSQPRFLLLALAGGLQMGVYGAWSGVLTLVMSKHFGTARVSGEHVLGTHHLLSFVHPTPFASPVPSAAPTHLRVFLAESSPADSPTILG